MEWAGHIEGPGFTVQGNILAGPEVVDAMGEAFTQTEGALATRLVAALAAGQAAGGEKEGGRRAAEKDQPGLGCVAEPQRRRLDADQGVVLEAVPAGESGLDEGPAQCGPR